MNSAVQRKSSLPSWLGAAAAWTYSILIGLGAMAILIEHQTTAGVLLLLSALVAFGYAVGTVLPTSNACQTATPGDMQRCTEAMRAIPEQERKHRYLELSKHFALPPLLEHSQKP